MRDRQILRVNESFDDIVENVARMLDDMNDNERRDGDEEDFR
jgi:hypothetical protein